MILASLLILQARKWRPRDLPEVIPLVNGDAGPGAEPLGSILASLQKPQLLPFILKILK